jgi:hypothetical protein
VHAALLVSVLVNVVTNISIPMPSDQDIHHSHLLLTYLFLFFFAYDSFFFLSADVQVSRCSFVLKQNKNALYQRTHTITARQER